MQDCWGIHFGGWQWSTYPFGLNPVWRLEPGRQLFLAGSHLIPLFFHPTHYFFPRGPGFKGLDGDPGGIFNRPFGLGLGSLGQHFSGVYPRGPPHGEGFLPRGGPFLRPSSAGVVSPPLAGLGENPGGGYPLMWNPGGPPSRGVARHPSYPPMGVGAHILSVCPGALL